MKKVTVIAGIGIFAVVAIAFVFNLLVKGDSVNRIEREVFISRGADDFNVYILNIGSQTKQYHAVSKVTAEVDKGYYFFWAEVNGKKLYVQTPIAQTVIEQR